MVCFSASALLYLSYQMTRLSGALFVKTEGRDKKLFRNPRQYNNFYAESQTNRASEGCSRYTIVWMNVECATQNMSI